MSSSKCQDDLDDDLEDDLDDVLTSMLECPVCLVTCTSPIYLCTNGHNVCGDCQKTLTACPVCRKDGRPSIRNLFAEQVSGYILVDCQNHAQGCKVSPRVRDMGAHLKVCEFGYKCMISPCDWRGSVSALGGHVKTKHPRGVLDVNERGATICVDSGKYVEQEDVILTSMLAYKKKIFWFHVDFTVLRSLFAVVRLIGPEGQNIASKSFYQLRFISECGRKIMIYRNDVRALSDSRAEFADSVFGGEFPMTCLLRGTLLKFCVNLFVAKKGAADEEGELNELFSCPQSWSDLEYKYVSLIRD